jgi:hypothetical protein
MDHDNKILIKQITEMASAGMVVPVDPEVADRMAAFEDHALSLDDALDSRFDDVAEEE